MWIRVVRAPHARARFTLGDLGPLRRRLAAVLTAADVPFNGYGIYPEIKDQPVLADAVVRYRGEAVVALVGERQTVLAIRDSDVPIAWMPEPPLFGVDAATAPEAPLVQVPTSRKTCCSTAAYAMAQCRQPLSPDARPWRKACSRTAFVEHAYVEPEAGWAFRPRRRSHRDPCHHPNALYGP